MDDLSDEVAEHDESDDASTTTRVMHAAFSARLS